MTPARYAHIGGALIADHGRMSLAQARDLVAFYRRQSADEARQGRPVMAGICEQRAHTLETLAAAASRWRRAAGWADPDLADRAHPPFP